MPSNSEGDAVTKVVPLAKSLAEVCWAHGIQCHGPITYQGMVFDSLTVDETGGVVGSANVMVARERTLVKFGFKLDTTELRRSSK